MILEILVFPDFSNSFTRSSFFKPFTSTRRSSKMQRIPYVKLCHEVMACHKIIHTFRDSLGVQLRQFRRHKNHRWHRLLDKKKGVTRKNAILKSSRIKKYLSFIPKETFDEKVHYSRCFHEEGGDITVVQTFKFQIQWSKKPSARTTRVGESATGIRERRNRKSECRFELFKS